MATYRSTVFIDLQGTLGGEGVGNISDFTFFPMSIEALSILNKNNFLVLIITNQSHIGKGIISWEKYLESVDKLKEILQKSNVYFDDIFCCPHTREERCNCKKPLTGLIELAREKYTLSEENRYLIGDMGSTDMVLAHRIGAKGILVKTGVGMGSLGEFRKDWKDIEPTFIAEDILGAVKWIVRNTF